MVVFETSFVNVEDGGKFAISNPNYKHDLWPNCGPALTNAIKLIKPTPEGFNAVTENGMLLKLKDDDEVVVSR
jgi:hypothetical protein